MREELGGAARHGEEAEAGRCGGQRGRPWWLELGPGPEMELRRARGRMAGFGCPVKHLCLHPKKDRKPQDGFR